MSYKERLSELNRDGDRPLTEQIVAIFRAAIAAGELAARREAAADPRPRRAGRRQPPDRRPRLPPARRARARQLAGGRRDLRPRRRRGRVARARARAGAGDRSLGRLAALRAAGAEGAYVDSILVDLFAGAEAREDLIPLMTGYPSERVFPAELLTRLTAETLERHGPAAWQYPRATASPAARGDRRARPAATGSSDGPERVVVTTGARQALDARRPGDHPPR